MAALIDIQQLLISSNICGARVTYYLLQTRRKHIPVGSRWPSMANDGLKQVVSYPGLALNYEVLTLNAT